MRISHIFWGGFGGDTLCALLVVLLISVVVSGYKRHMRTTTALIISFLVEISQLSDSTSDSGGQRNVDWSMAVLI
ncbi:MAG: DUF2809 domain-containing protein [Planctomycetaceae bacterium]|nr:DUF2809 domain-containing protein [Planctomycetaceae bacterium]MBN8604092.1 DUF2809 domain-containing protein [Planctomycetota bacterium]